jgi:hypothetical protein
MPIIDHDWSLQFFAGVPCPDDVLIPTGDAEAWKLHPAHNWIYNKLLVAQSQALMCAPHGVMPDAFPVFSKPAINLYGMGAGTRILRSAREFDAAHQPGHFWMELLEGEHVSTDVALVNGEPRWWRHAIGHPAYGGMFDYWTVLGEARASIEAYCGRWLKKHLGDYSGLINLETIGCRIIEAHLRMTDQWPDLYGGRAWVEAVVELYRSRRWNAEGLPTGVGYSMALFAPHGGAYKHPSQHAIDAVLRRPDITSIQITFWEETPPEQHSNPPGGFRLALVNATDLDAAREARQDLAGLFGLTEIINDTRGGRVHPVRSASTSRD